MDSKRGKTLVGALVAVTVSTFAIPFGSIAASSTGTQITRHDAGTAVQLAQVEQQETEEKTEQKTKEVQGGAEVVPAPVVVAPCAVEQRHEERKTTESEHSDNGLSGTSERHENEMSSDAKSAPGAVESEHEEHETKEKVEQN
jgi:hypothetical protein